MPLDTGPHLSDYDWLCMEREYCSRSLANYTKRAWKVLEPVQPLVWGWPLDAVAEHLQAVHRGEILYLMMNVPPGMMKSLMVNVFFPTWEWGPSGRPDLRFLNTSHKLDLGVRDNVKARRLIKSDWYQSLWGEGAEDLITYNRDKSVKRDPRVILAADQDAKVKFENTATGFKEVMAFTSLTGSRGDRLTIDDPLSVDDAESEAALNAAETTFKEAVPSRLNNDRSATILIMQRLHQRDPCGLIDKLDLPYVKLVLPMEFEPDRRCVTKWYADPRKKSGELLLPGRFSAQKVADLKKQMLEYAVAGQLQQRPAPREGGMFKRAWFNPVYAAPVGTTWVRGWDLASTKRKSSPWTAGVKIGRTPEGRYLIGDATRERETPGGVERMLKTNAVLDGRNCVVSVPQDPGQAGVHQKTYYAQQLAGFVVKFSPESGDKVARARPLASQCEAGNVDILMGPWVETFLEEITMFPASEYADQVDAASRAFAELTSSAYTLENL